MVKVLHDAFKKGLEEPSYVAAMTQLDQEMFYLGSESYERFAREQIAEAKRLSPSLASSRTQRRQFDSLQTANWGRLPRFAL